MEHLQSVYTFYNFIESCGTLSALVIVQDCNDLNMLFKYFRNRFVKTILTIFVTIEPMSRGTLLINVGTPLK